MSTTDMERILIEALDLLEAGQPIEAILERYPREAEELRPYLSTTAQLSTYAHQPLEVARRRSKAALLAAADSAADSRPATGARWARLLRPVLAMLLVAVIAFSAMGVVATEAIPGDSLYAAKQVVEQAQLRLIADPEAQARLREQHNQERVAEVMALLAQGRSAAVTFAGELESMDGERWTVAGVPVQVPPGTTIDGLALVGRRIEVSGVVQGDGVIADRIIVLNGLPETPEPDLLPSPTPSRTPAPSPTAPALIEATASPTTPATPQPVPSATATAPGDDDNDNGNANDDDDGNANDDDGGNSNEGDDNGNANDDDDGNSNEGDDNVNSNEGDDNGNANDDDGGNANDDDGGNSNEDDDNGNANDDDGGNSNEDDDNSNANDDDNGNANDDDDSNSNEGDDKGNANDDDNGNSNDDNANDDDDNDSGSDDDNDNGNDNGD